MNKYFKLLIAALLVASAAYMFYEREYGSGIALLLLSIIPIFFYFRNEYILLAFWQLRQQNMEKAKKWLSKIKNPQKQLVRKQMGYYYFLRGLTEGQDNLVAAERDMKKSLDYGLSFAHDRAMAKLNIAAAAMTRGQKNEAKRWLKEAKTEDKQNMLTDQIKMMEGQMKKINVGRNMQNPHMRQRGKYF